LVFFRGEPYRVVHDPVALKYHHLLPAQYEVWCQLDGRRNIEAIRQSLAKKFPTSSMRSSDVQALITDLHQKGLTWSTRLEQGERLARRAWDATKQKLLNAFLNPFFIKFPPINPRHAVSVFSILFGWLFTRLGMALASLVIIGAWLEAAVRFETLSAALPTLQSFFGWPNLLWLWLMIGATKVAHEMGHAVACRSVGRECHGIGAGMLVFSPTLYCDATDSWMCESKWQRILVASGGMYIELLVGAIAVFIWSHTHPGRIHSLALNVAAVSTVSTVLFNANPLIRFDGYYILSDWLEIPNLQEKSSRLLYRVMAWCIGITTESNASDPKTGQGWFVTYAVLACIYRWFIMSVILMAVYSMVRPYRIESLGGAWVVAIAAMSSVGVFKSWKNISRTKKDGFFSKRRLMISLAFSLALVIAFFMVPVPWWSSMPVQTELRDPVSIYARVEGRLEEIYALEGQAISEGHLIAKLSNPILDDQVRSLRLSVKQLKCELDALEMLDRHADIILKQQELERTQKRLLETMPLQQELSVRSPTDGLLIHGQFQSRHPSSETLPKWSGWPLATANIGALIPAGTLLAQVVSDPKDVMCVCYIDQTIREDLKIDQFVQLRFDSLPHDVFDGRIISVSPVSLEVVPQSLSQRFGGRITSAPDSNGNEIVESRIYRVVSQVPGDPRILPYLRGKCRLRLKDDTLWYRLTRFSQNTFYFRL
jgi:putative peptide zinc metalloprotease protein